MGESDWDQIKATNAVSGGYFVFIVYFEATICWVLVLRCLRHHSPDLVSPHSALEGGVGLRDGKGLT